MAVNNKGKILYELESINIIPLLIYSIVMLLLSNHWFTKSMYHQVEGELQAVAGNIITMYDALYPGDYRLEGKEICSLYKGEQNITNDFSLIDRIKADSGMDITLFYQNTRFLTTINDANGARIVGSTSTPRVLAEVFEAGEPHFYTKAIINCSSYFAYYAPITGSDEKVVGMIFVGKPTAEVDAAIWESIQPLLISVLLLLVFVFIFTFLYTKKIASCLFRINVFLKEVASGNLTAKLDSNVMKRNDELSEIAHSALEMQTSIRTLVEQDALTNLLNRRSGDRKLREVIAASEEKQKPFCIAIGDIDLFKNVNDTYGHDAGDVILKNVAARLRLHMHGHGFVARWGGEEFLLVFENRHLEEANQILEEALQNIRAEEHEYDGQIIKITMTFGLISGDHSNITDLLRAADAKLYAGKTGGRNQIVT